MEAENRKSLSKYTQASGNIVSRILIIQLRIEWQEHSHLAWWCASRMFYALSHKQSNPGPWLSQHAMLHFLQLVSLCKICTSCICLTIHTSLVSLPFTAHALESVMSVYILYMFSMSFACLCTMYICEQYSQHWYPCHVRSYYLPVQLEIKMQPCSSNCYMLDTCCIPVKSSCEHHQWLVILHCCACAVCIEQ